jgi:hypothetical protein
MPPVMMVPMMVAPAPMVVMAPAPMTVVPAPMTMMPMPMPVMAPAHLLRREPAGLFARSHRTMNISLRGKGCRRQRRCCGVGGAQAGACGQAQSKHQGELEKTSPFHAFLRIPEGVDRVADCHRQAERTLNCAFRCAECTGFEGEKFPDDQAANVSAMTKLSRVRVTSGQSRLKSAISRFISSPPTARSNAAASSN